MSTMTASAVSNNPGPGRAATEAIGAAATRLNGESPSFGFLFASPHRDLRTELRSAREAAPGAAIIGCSTAGEITELGLVHDGVAALLVASDTCAARTAFADGLRVDPQGVARKLSGSAGELRKQIGGRGADFLTTVLLTDGLSGTGERLVADLYDRAHGAAQIVGGAAGDGGKFMQTHVGAGEDASSDGAASMHVFSASPWGVGVSHGLRSTTPPMRVTKAIGNVVFELDGEAAFGVYVRHAARRGIHLTRESAAPYLVGNELGIHFFDRILRVRAPFTVGFDGSLWCPAEIPQGSMVSILEGDPANMVDAARSAAVEAKEHLGGVEAAGVLVFDCVCRGMILGDVFDREIETVRSEHSSAKVVSRMAGRAQQLGEPLGQTTSDPSTIALLLVDPSACVVFADVQAEAMFGRGFGELVGEPLEALVSDRSWVIRLAACVSDPTVRHRVGAHGVGREPPLRGRRRDGFEFPVEVSLSPIPGPGGARVAVVVRDTSEPAVPMERTLREAQERFRMALDEAPIGMALVGLDHHICAPIARFAGCSRIRPRSSPASRSIP